MDLGKDDRIFATGPAKPSAKYSHRSAFHHVSLELLMTFTISFASAIKIGRTNVRFPQGQHHPIVPTYPTCIMSFNVHLQLHHFFLAPSPPAPQQPVASSIRRSRVHHLTGQISGIKCRSPLLQGKCAGINSLRVANCTNLGSGFESFQAQTDDLLARQFRT